MVGLLLVAATACGGQDNEVGLDGTWVGTITTEGNVTTVMNESGSVWGGTARLVEEASIGVAEGPEHYMLDRGITVYADRSRIYVVQSNLPSVRLYDHDGQYLADLGAHGEGPGEFQIPVFVAGSIDGRIFVYDSNARRLNAYDGSGVPVGKWTVPEAVCCVWPPALSPTGDLWMPVFDIESGAVQPRVGVQRFGISGREDPVLWVPDFDYEHKSIMVEGRAVEQVPFAPIPRWAAAPDGVVAGVSDRYRFLLMRDDGATLVVTRPWESAPVHPEQAEWYRKWQIARIRSWGPPDWVWQGDEIPDVQEAFTSLIPTASGEVWVARPGNSYRVQDCLEDPRPDEDLFAPSAYCWRSTMYLDAFDRNGMYLGGVEVPEGFVPSTQNLFVRDDLVLAIIEDEAGTIMVKRYRLVLPGEE